MTELMMIRLEISGKVDRETAEGLVSVLKQEQSLCAEKSDMTRDDGETVSLLHLKDLVSLLDYRGLLVLKIDKCSWGHTHMLEDYLIKRGFSYIKETSGCHDIPSTRKMHVHYKHCKQIHRPNSRLAREGFLSREDVLLEIGRAHV